MKKKIILKRVFHRGRWRILISFVFDQGLSALVRQVENCRYSNTFKSWYIDDDEAVLKQVFLIFRDMADIDLSALTKKPIKCVETINSAETGNIVETGLRPVSTSKNREKHQPKAKSFSCPGR